MLRRLFNLGKAGAEASDNNQYGIDTDCNYCPKCGDEYRAEIEKCAACAIPLIPGSEKLANLKQQETDLRSRSLEISVDDELVTIQIGKLGYLKPLQQVLKAEHVPSMLAGENPAKG